MKMTVFHKLQEIKELVKKNLDLPEEALKPMVQRLANRWHYKKDRKKGDKLTKEEAMLYELLIMNSYNPSTIYRWLLLEETPTEIREKLRDKNISQRQASKCKMEFRNMLNTTEQDLMEEIKDCVKRYITR